jgi:hypothetical protein
MKRRGFLAGLFGMPLAEAAASVRQVGTPSLAEALVVAERLDASVGETSQFVATLHDPSGAVVATEMWRRTKPTIAFAAARSSFLIDHVEIRLGNHVTWRSKTQRPLLALAPGDTVTVALPL